MPEFRLRYPASALAGKHRLTADDILLLRKHMFPEGLTSTDDASQLLALHRSGVEKCAGWDNWFVEMMTAFIVVRCYPHYSLDALNADWLIAMFSQQGTIETTAELEAVLHTMEMASSVPDTLSALALDQLRLALKDGKGAYAAQRMKRAGVSAADIDFIHRILRGSLCAGKFVLSAREVAVLDRIDGLVRGEVNHPAWYGLMRSIEKRNSDGHASPMPWLQMLADDVALDEAA
jgi:hypothetical protein